MSAYEEWKAKNPPRPDNEWDRFVAQAREIDAAIEKCRKLQEEE